VKKTKIYGNAELPRDTEPSMATPPLPSWEKIERRFRYFMASRRILHAIKRRYFSISLDGNESSAISNYITCLKTCIASSNESESLRTHDGKLSFTAILCSSKPTFICIALEYLI
jgi:hypothetical protein